MFGLLPFRSTIVHSRPVHISELASTLPCLLHKLPIHHVPIIYLLKLPSIMWDFSME